MTRRTLARLHRRNARPCLGCGRLTVGSNWLNTGEPMLGVCVACKAAADAEADRQLSALAANCTAIDGAVAAMLGSGVLP